MKRNLLFFSILIVITTIFSGCSQNELIEKNVGLESDSDYISYKKLKDDNSLNDDGYYTYEAETETNNYDIVDTTGKVHITFGKNSYLNINYYSDSKMSKDSLISTEYCYLSPGTKVYAKVQSVNNPNSNLYEFSKFIIQEYDKNGKLKGAISQSVLKNNIVYSIPKSNNLTEISIIPIGTFKNRNFKLSTYYIDDNGKKQKIDDVKWLIDGKEISSSNTISVDPVKSYTVSCDFSKLSDDYYFKDSSPQYFNYNEEKNIIEFYQKSSVDSTSNYEIILHRFIKVNITNSKNIIKKIFDKITLSKVIKSIEFNDQEAKTTFFSNNAELTGLKEGNKITIIVADGYQLKSKEVIISNGVPVEDGLMYTITIPSTNLTEINISTEEKG